MTGAWTAIDRLPERRCCGRWPLQLECPQPNAHAYAIEWRWGLNQKSIVGRLYGIQDGKDVGTFWEFREIGHPGERRVVSMQFGTAGTYGVGPHEIEPDGSSEMLQVFHDPARDTSAKIGHRAKLKGDVHTTTSFDVDEKGVWTERRTYVWRHQPGALPIDLHGR